MSINGSGQRSFQICCAAFVCTGLFAFVLLGTSFIGISFAQQNRSLTIQGDAERGKDFHKDLFGKPCVSFEAISRAYVSDSHIFDHIVSANNHCPQLIQLRICYQDTLRCVYVPLGAYERKESVLGVDAIRDFKYQASESN